VGNCRGRATSFREWATLDYIVDVPLDLLQSSFVPSLLDLDGDFDGLLSGLSGMLRRYGFGLGCCLGVFRVPGLIGSGDLAGLGLSFARSLLDFPVVRPVVNVGIKNVERNVPSRTTL
jgi:hypothetical protein